MGSCISRSDDIDESVLYDAVENTNRIIDDTKPLTTELQRRKTKRRRERRYFSDYDPVLSALCKYNLVDITMLSRNDFFVHVSKPPKSDIATPTDCRLAWKKARERFVLDTANCYNFAFIGASKSGKTSLVNAIRGLFDNSVGAGEVNVTDYSGQISMYTFASPLLEHVRFFDISTSVDPNGDDVNSNEEISLCAFDCVLICTNGNVYDSDINLALGLLRLRQPFAFIRSKCDESLDHLRKTRKISRITQSVVLRIIDKLKAIVQPKIYSVPELAFARVPIFYIAAPIVRTLIRGQCPDYVLDEQDFFEFLTHNSMTMRGL